MQTHAEQPVVERGIHEARASARRALWAIIAVSTILRLAWAAGMGAAIDEPYYFQYIQHPALSYFDHPPMVAVVGGLGIALAGDAFSVFGLRLGFIALFAGSTWLLARLTERFYGPRAGVLAAFTLSASGYFGMVVGTIALPDGPLLFFWLLTLDRLAVALNDPDRRAHWLGVGAAWGGAMLSKYHAFLLPAGALLHMVFWPPARRYLRKPGPYLAAAIGLVLFAPVIAWNATHDWASIRFQGGRAAFSQHIRLGELGAVLGIEALYLFPWLWAAMMVELVKLIRRRRRAWDESESFLLWQAAPALVLFHVIATRRWIMPYWPLFGFIALLPLLGRAWAQGLKMQRRWHRIGIAAVALFPILLAALVTAQHRFGFFEDSRGRLIGLFKPVRDFTADPSAWKQIASELERRGLLNAPQTFLFTDSWDRSASLAYATRGKAPVACYNVEPRSYAFWSRPEDWVGRDGIFIESMRAPVARSRYHQFFARYESIGTVPIVLRGAFVGEAYLYRGTDQTRPFPFDGRFQKLAERRKLNSGSPAALGDQSIARRHDDESRRAR